jgi:hypothetical protein
MSVQFTIASGSLPPAKSQPPSSPASSLSLVFGTPINAFTTKPGRLQVCIHSAAYSLLSASPFVSTAPGTLIILPYLSLPRCASTPRREFRVPLPEFLANTHFVLSRPLLELANYHVLGRILYYVPYHAPLHPGRTLTTFGTLSFFIEMLNALGVALLSNPNVSQKKQDLGHILMKTALIT